MQSKKAVETTQVELGAIKAECVALREELVEERRKVEELMEEKRALEVELEERKQNEVVFYTELYNNYILVLVIKWPLYIPLLHKMHLLSYFFYIYLEAIEGRFGEGEART